MQQQRLLAVNSPIQIFLGGKVNNRGSGSWMLCACPVCIVVVVAATGVLGYWAACLLFLLCGVAAKGQRQLAGARKSLCCSGVLAAVADSSARELPPPKGYVRLS